RRNANGPPSTSRPSHFGRILRIAARENGPQTGLLWGTHPTFSVCHFHSGRLLGKIEGSPLGGWGHREVGVHVRHGGADRRFERGIVPPGIVVERYQVLDARQPGEGQRIVHRAVSPANVYGVLLARVLRVVEEQIYLLRQVEAGRP